MNILSRSLPPAVLAVVSITALVSASRPALAAGSVKAECSAAYEKSQEQRTDGKLKSARETLAVCARDACPSFVKSECKQWLEEVTNDVPTALIDAKDPDGQPTKEVSVTIDGELLSQTLGDAAIELDPGEHNFRFELAGAVVIEKRVYLEKGTRAQPLHLQFESETPKPAGTPAADVDVESSETTTTTDRTSLRPWAYVAGGVGAAGVIGFAVFGALGKSRESDLKDSCSPRCSSDDIDSVKSKYHLADISLGVGIVGLGTGVALFLLSQPAKHPQEDTARALRFDVKTSSSNAFATVSGRF
jgi:hypothetical protein